MAADEFSPGVAAPKPRLLQQVRDAIRRKHYSPRTEESYVHWIRRFVHFHGKRHPREIGEAGVTVEDDDAGREHARRHGGAL